MKIKNFIASILVLLISSLFYWPSIAKAATVVSTFQITSEGSQQTSPFIYDDLVVYTSLSDIWGYDLKTNTNLPILEKENQQFTTGFYKNLIIYENSNPDLSTDVYMYNLTNDKDTLVAGGLGSQGSGVTNGKVVAYVDGGACGSIHVYNIKDKTSTKIFDLSCFPLRISRDTLVFPAADPNGTNIKGYNLKKNELFDVSTESGFQESANIFGDKVVWLDYVTGARGDYNAIKMKDLKTGEVTTIYESSTDSLQSPSVSNKYVVWSQSSAQHVGGVRGANLKTGEIFEVQPQGPHQNSHTSTSIWKDTAVWMSFRTGNGDIYGAIFNKE